MSKMNKQKSDPVELTENELGDVRGGTKVTALCMDTITKKSTADSRDTDGNTHVGNGSPVYSLPEEFAP